MDQNYIFYSSQKGQLLYSFYRKKAELRINGCLKSLYFDLEIEDYS